MLTRKSEEYSYEQPDNYASFLVLATFGVVIYNCSEDRSSNELSSHVSFFHLTRFYFHFDTTLYIYLTDYASVSLNRKLNSN